jgi:hypothetical protein
MLVGRRRDVRAKFEELPDERQRAVIDRVLKARADVDR